MSPRSYALVAAFNAFAVVLNVLGEPSTLNWFMAGLCASAGIICAGLAVYNSNATRR